MMNPDWKNTLLVSAVALSLFAAPAVAAELGEWDQDADSTLNEEEFRAGFEENGVFGDWDTDDDNMLSEGEFNTGVGENTEAFNERFGEDAFSEWDEDGDEMVSEDEFYGGVYAGYDRDDDNVIEEPEFSDLGDDMGDGGFWDV